MSLYNMLLAEKLSGGSGGSSNIVAGEFTASSGGAFDVPVNYNGEGYPLTIMIFPETSWTDVSGLECAISLFGATKSSKDVVPTYSGTTLENQYYGTSVLNRGGTDYAYVIQNYYCCKASGASSSKTGSSRWFTFKNKNTLNVYAQESSSYYGVAVGVKYRYMIEYSA